MVAWDRGLCMWSTASTLDSGSAALVAILHAIHIVGWPHQLHCPKWTHPRLFFNMHYTRSTVEIEYFEGHRRDDISSLGTRL